MAVIFCITDTLVFSEMVRSAQIISEVELARGQAVEPAVVGERLRAAEEPQAAADQALAGVTAKAAAVREALFRDVAEARSQIAAAGSAREAVAPTRTVAAVDHRLSRREPATLTGDGGGLANLTARVQAASGQLTARQAEGGCELTAEIPLCSALPFRGHVAGVSVVP